ncbi:MAG: hypothetical protein SOX60_06745 [Prevotella sp.]|nr:hypothetical protein [Prevotella sp.]
MTPVVFDPIMFLFQAWVSRVTYLPTNLGIASPTNGRWPCGHMLAR